jgi:hypothetical protein
MHHVTHIQSLPVLPDIASINSSLAFCEFKIFTYLRTYIAISKQNDKPTPLVFTGFRACCDRLYHHINAERMLKKMKGKVDRMVKKVIAYFASEKDLIHEFDRLDAHEKYMLQHYGGAWLLYFYQVINVIGIITIEDKYLFTHIKPTMPKLSLPCLDQIIEFASEESGVEILMVAPYISDVDSWVQDINIRQIYNGAQSPDKNNRFTYAGSVNAALHDVPYYPRFSTSSRALRLI